MEKEVKEYIDTRLDELEGDINRVISTTTKVVDNLENKVEYHRAETLGRYHQLSSRLDQIVDSLRVIKTKLKIK